MESFDVAVVGLGALGSATAYHLAQAGVEVVGFEQFELGHVRGASHDTSRIIRHSYESEDYVRLAVGAYQEWADFERASGETFVTETGGLVFCAPDTPVPADEYAAALSAVGIPFELLDPQEVAARWPNVHLPEGTVTVYTPSSGIVPAARSVAALQIHARIRGAVLRANCPVERLEPVDGGVVVHSARGPVLARKVVVTADAWTNALLAPLGASVPLEVMQEQVTYFVPEDPGAFALGTFPNWIWEGPVAYYGFPTYGEPTIKAARDVSQIAADPDARTFVPSEERIGELQRFLRGIFDGSGEVLRTVTCQYAITPGREFVLDSVPQHPDVIVGLGAGHAFKYTPVIGRILAELATGAEPSYDISRFRFPGVVTA
jgi:sarcosine oxidase